MYAASRKIHCDFLRYFFFSFLVGISRTIETGETVLGVGSRFNARAQYSCDKKMSPGSDLRAVVTFSAVRTFVSQCDDSFLLFLLSLSPSLLFEALAFFPSADTRFFIVCNQNFGGCRCTRQHFNANIQMKWIRPVVHTNHTYWWPRA